MAGRLAFLALTCKHKPSECLYVYIAALRVCLCTWVAVRERRFTPGAAVPPPSPPPALRREAGAPTAMAGAPPLSLDQVQQLARELDAASRAGAEAVRGALPAADLLGHLGAALLLLKEQPTLLELEISDPEVEVVVVGDTHGHFHDVLHMCVEEGRRRRRVFGMGSAAVACPARGAGD